MFVNSTGIIVLVIEGRVLVLKKSFLQLHEPNAGSASPIVHYLASIDMMFVIRRLQELARKKRIPLYIYFINLTKAYDSVDRTLLWTVLARFGVPQTMISAIRHFHDGMRACVRLDDRVCSGWFNVE